MPSLHIGRSSRLPVLYRFSCLWLGSSGAVSLSGVLLGYLSGDVFQFSGKVWEHIFWTIDALKLGWNEFGNKEDQGDGQKTRQTQTTSPSLVSLGNHTSNKRKENKYWGYAGTNPLKSVGVMGGVETNMATKVLIKSTVWATPRTHMAEMLQCQDWIFGPEHSWIPLVGH